MKDDQQIGFLDMRDLVRALVPTHASASGVRNNGH